MDHEVLVLAGPGGSKSTFIWGLYNYIDHYEDSLNPVYRGVEGNVAEDFRKGVVEQMSQHRKYPNQTTEGYVIEISIDRDSQVLPKSKFNFVDYPGERIGDVLRPMLDDIRNEAVDWDQVHSKFNESLKAKIGGDTQVEFKEWKTILTHYYGRATKVIFLLNFYKLFVEDEDPVFNAEDLRTVADDKIKVALIPTAVDLIEDPDEYELSDSAFDTGGLSKILNTTPQMIDENLVQFVQRKVTEADSPSASNMWNEIKTNNRIDFFGTAVPAENPKSDKIRDGSKAPFKTKGFDQVITWLKE